MGKIGIGIGLGVGLCGALAVAYVGGIITTAVVYGLRPEDGHKLVDQYAELCEQWNRVRAARKA